MSSQSAAPEQSGQSGSLFFTQPVGQIPSAAALHPSGAPVPVPVAVAVLLAVTVAVVLTVTVSVAVTLTVPVPVVLVAVTVAVVPTLAPVPRPSPLHPAATALTRKTDSAVSFTRTEHTRFDMVPPVARDTGAMDALSPTGLVYLETFLPHTTAPRTTRLHIFPHRVYGERLYQAEFRATRRGFRVVQKYSEEDS
jgi:hypothetical protein